VAADPQRSCVDRFIELARRDAVGLHSLNDRPEEADVLLFPDAHLFDGDWRQARIRSHPLLRRWPGRSYVYNERDNPWCSWPGLYVSYPQSAFSWSRQRPAAYYRIDADFDRHRPPGLLFSLMATPTHPCRIPLYELRHPDAHVERTEGFVFYDPSSVSFNDRRERYRSVVSDSLFVLCPRGGGTSSIRLYETLAAGRVPVIISDAWTPPLGPDWSACSIRWPEGVTDGLVEHLESMRDLAPAMGARARSVFEAWFAPEVAFHHLASLLEQLHQSMVAADHGPLHDDRWAQVARTSLRVGLGRKRRSVADRVGRIIRRRGSEP
jgi:hypothetical protein